MQHLATYLDMLFGAEPAGGLIELRSKTPTGMAQSWFPCEDRSAVAEAIQRLGRSSDTYIGVAPRRRPCGRREAVEKVHALWADADGLEPVRRLASFQPSPSIVVRSGSGENFHAYWSIWPPATPDVAEDANRRLAQALQADPVAHDTARILRPPGSLNHKGEQPVEVVAEYVAADDVFTVADVVGNLDAPQRQPRRSETPARWSDDALMAIPATTYVEIFTGREIGRDGKVCCPFHDDRRPSLHTYADPARGWICYGCRRGGTIIDFGRYLYGLEPRGAEFHEIRRRLIGALIGEAVAA